MKDRFSGQVALITGGARGIGEAVGERIAREGGKVFLADILERELVETVKRLSTAGLDVTGKKLDITNEGEVRKVVDEVVSEAGHLDILVHGAGIAGPNAIKITDYSLEDFQKVIDVNLTGTFLMTKYCIPPMLKQNYGRMLLIASIGGKEGNPGMVGYAASKSGVMGLVKAVGKEYAQTGITVNGLAPAVIATPMNLDTQPETMNYMVSKIPMGRLGTVEETAAIICWIVSKEASFNTGFVFDLSGGRATF